ncbi:NAD(P)H-hydrate epimerase / ADP-dependent (S)-NAD(P)H-hydrate dehydratase [hydrothermal vent metagenome]|uniref:Nicotinamide nucleotide repair protein n=1 Tax=hydrothermal vent metagenome TaxID=652676 RepID=A0A3B0Z6D5_9ZZZZ
MNPLPHTLYSVEQTRALDRLAIEQYAIPGIVLMERAGEAAFELLMARWPKAQNIVVLCGGGNNGGDGLVVARLAQQAGLSVTLSLLLHPDTLKGEAREAFEALKTLPITAMSELTQRLDECDVIVDALLGTGLTSGVRGEYAAVIEQINQVARPTLSLDLPSGLNADSGQVMGCAVEATVTIAFIGLNRGLLTGEGPGYCGDLHFSDLSLPDALYQQLGGSVERIDYAALKRLIRSRPAHAHKGMCGHVLLVGGDRGMSGAIRLAGEAALRSGSGLVSIATRREHAALMTAQRPELMSHGVANEAELMPLFSRATVIVCGPGLGTGVWGQEMLAQVLAQPQPLVLDADALNLLAQNPQQRENWLLTPHPAEAARLLSISTAEVVADRFAAVAALQQRYGGYVLLKGAGTLMCDPSGEIALCSDGNPGMASGGMGDLLSGVLAALIAQGMVLPHALPLGVALHAAAGDRAAGQAPRGLLASDLLPYLRQLVNSS